jgi:hypothetical protein
MGQLSHAWSTSDERGRWIGNGGPPHRKKWRSEAAPVRTGGGEEQRLRDSTVGGRQRRLGAARTFDWEMARPSRFTTLWHWRPECGALQAPARRENGSELQPRRRKTVMSSSSMRASAWTSPAQGAPDGEHVRTVAMWPALISRCMWRSCTQPWSRMEEDTQWWAPRRRILQILITPEIDSHRKK